MYILYIETSCVFCWVWLHPEFGNKDDRHLQAGIQKTRKDDGRRGLYYNLFYHSGFGFALVYFLLQLVAAVCELTTSSKILPQPNPSVLNWGAI